jgi:hypothetical protein
MDTRDSIDDQIKLTVHSGHLSGVSGKHDLAST